MTRIKADSCIFFKKSDNGKLERIISVHVDNLCMTGKPETLKNIKRNGKSEFQYSIVREVKKFLGIYYEWGRDAKGPYAKINMYKYVKKLFDGYRKFVFSDIKVHKTPRAPGTTINNSDL